MSLEKKVLFTFSDLHVGHLPVEQLRKELFDPENGILEKMDLLAQEYEKSGATIIGCACTGDFFDHKISVDSEYAKTALEFVQELYSLFCMERDGVIIMLRGTYAHDFSQNDIFRNYEELSEGSFVVVNNVSEFEVEGLEILCVPEEYMKNQEEYYADTIYSGKRYNIILGHGFFKMNCFNKNEVERPVPSMPIFDQDHFCNIADLVVFGHDHGRISYKSKLHYNGSTSRLCFSDEEAKGFLVHEIDMEDGLVKKVLTKFVENELTLKFKTHFLPELVKSEYTFEDAVKAIEEKAKDFDYLKVKVLPSDVALNPNIISLLKEYFARKPNITIEGSNIAVLTGQALPSLKEGDTVVEDDESPTEKSIGEFAYFYDNSVPLAKKILKFIESKHSEKFDLERISEEDIVMAITKED